MKLKILVAASIAILITACATTPPRSIDNVALARIAKDYIGVGSIDEMELSNIQKIPVGGDNILGKSQYRFFVDTARKKKYVCDVTLWGLKGDGQPFNPDVVKCEAR